MPAGVPREGGLRVAASRVAKVAMPEAEAAVVAGVVAARAKAARVADPKGVVAAAAVAERATAGLAEAED